VEHHATGKTGMQPMVEVPDHMAGAAAFNDMLGSDSSIAPHHFGVSSPAAAFETSVIVPAPPIPTAEYEVPTSWREEKLEPMAGSKAEAEPEVVATPVEAAPEPIAEEVEPETVAMEALAEPEESPMPAEASVPMSADAAAASHPQFIPVYKEPEAEATSYEVVPTGAPPTGDMEIPREPELQETANETTRATVADHVEPGLLSAQEKYFVAEPERAAAWSSSANSTSTASEPIQAPTAEVAPPEKELAPLPGIRATGEVTDTDFEARVAAAMAAYSHATESAPATAEGSAATSAGVPAEPSDNAVQAEIVGGSKEAPSFEYRPPARASEIENAFAANKSAAMPEISGAEQVVATPTFSNPVSSPPAQEPKASEPEVIHDAVTSGVEAAAVAAAAETGADHHNIAQAVHRVMERLKPELVEEIMRELRSRK
jgi:hypothetical protein